MTKNLFLGAALVFAMAGMSSAQQPMVTATQVAVTGTIVVVFVGLVGGAPGSSTSDTQ